MRHWRRLQAGLTRAGLLGVVLAIVACSGGGNDNSSTSPQASATVLVDSGARWVGTSEVVDGSPLESFDLTLLRTDPSLVGIETFWEFKLIDPGEFLTINVEIEQHLDEQRVRSGMATPSVRGSTERIAESDNMRISPTEDGFVVSYVFAPRSASDLFDENGEPTGIRSFEITADFDEGTASLTDVDFFEDRGDDGVLIYDLALIGRIGPAGLNSTVRFAATESDPEAERVENDPAAVEAVAIAQSAQAAEQAGCASDDFVIDASNLAVRAADSTTVLTSELPASWSIELDPTTDPCTPPFVAVSSTPQDSFYDELSLSVWFVPQREASVLAEAERFMETTNLGFEDGEEITLEPGDEWYTVFDPLEELMIWDRPAVSVTGRFEDDPDLTTTWIFVWLDDRLVELRWSEFPQSNVRELVETFIDSTTVN